MSLYEWLGISNQELQARFRTNGNCIIEGCSEPYHKEYALCEEHLKAYRDWRRLKE